MEYLLILISAIQRADQKPHNSGNVREGELYEFNMSTIPREEELEAESEEILCNTKLDSTVKSVDRDCDNGVAKISSTKELLMHHLETGTAVKFRNA